MVLPDKRAVTQQMVLLLCLLLIGKGKAESSFDRVLRLDGTAEFSADVLSRQMYFGKQEGFDLGAHRAYF